jgi:hypothetical protein
MNYAANVKEKMPHMPRTVTQYVSVNLELFGSIPSHAALRVLDYAA